MKILYHHRTASRDGQAVHIDELISALRSLGHEVTVVGPRFEVSGGFGGESKTVRALKNRLPKAVFQVLELAYSIVAFAALYRACRRQRPDVLYERYNLHLLAGAWLSRWQKLRYILEVNAPLYEERAREGGIGLHGLGRWCERTSWRSADVVLPVSGVLAEYVEAAGVSRSRIVVMPNGIDHDHFLRPADGAAVRARYSLGTGLVIGFVGFIRDWHGLHKVVEALGDPSLPPVHLLVVGDGPGREALQQQARQLGVERRLTITGVVDRDHIAAMIAAFDIALQPSATRYASPLKLFEYMAAGRAILAPRQPNIEEVLTHERSALLFDPADDADFRGALARLCRDQDLRRLLGEGARAEIVSRGLTWIDNARRVAELFKTDATADETAGSWRDAAPGRRSGRLTST